MAHAFFFLASLAWNLGLGMTWLAVPLYWIHQFEEYSLPVMGLDYSIQEMIWC